MRHIIPVCGISGCISTVSGLALSGIAAQLACQRHRGPDAAGHFASERGAIAQNRLAVIDLSTGDPPVTSEDATIGAVLNGEIYNFETLREQLARRGHRLATSGDTEVLAHLAEELDAGAMAQALDGMFAFAVWDTRSERLTLGRDRLGKKPLYYWHDAGTFVFASEIKGVLAHPAVRVGLDERALSAYLTFGYVPTPDTFFAGIKSLAPAHTLTLSPGGTPRLERYWQLEVPGTPRPTGEPARHLELGLDAAAAEVRKRLGDAVGRRLVADVPVGAFLSGGIDSSAIVALMAAGADRPVHTFTIGFDDDQGFDERPYARAVARHLGTDHHEHVVHADAVDLVDQLVAFHDQPFGDSSAIPTFLLNQVARQHVTVALSGDGGDELFGGYERFAGALAVDRVAGLPVTLRRAGSRLAEQLAPGAFGGRAGKLQRFAAEVDRGLPWAYLNWISYVPEDWRRRLLSATDDRGHADYLARWQATAGGHPLDRLLALNLGTYLVDDLLVKADRMSMAHGLEVRSPFLDTALLEFAVQLEPALKVRGLSLKRVLKRAVADLLPAEILQRPKRGFGVPLDRWFRSDLAGYTASMLGPDAHLRAHVDGAALDALCGEHRAGASHGHALWTLLTLELFLRRHGW